MTTARPLPLPLPSSEVTDRTAAQAPGTEGVRADKAFAAEPFALYGAPEDDSDGSVEAYA
ncbi:hypothetical protein [Alloyangia mangrovi]|uniref:Uncharacterized protein n=1 Tax=Alloyangia mangrovi TaxID=1779329 RepID=A0A2A3JU69_9RHOB|nr:hypothetical protein [Alloyangia mangrovi]